MAMAREHFGSVSALFTTAQQALTETELRTAVRLPAVKVLDALEWRLAGRAGTAQRVCAGKTGGVCIGWITAMICGAGRLDSST